MQIHSGRFTAIDRLDEPGPGGAYHEYQVRGAMYDPSHLSEGAPAVQKFAAVKFQKGGVKESGGVNGCFMEDLLMIVADRLECFQAGPFPHAENAHALDYVRAAIAALDRRTQERQNRGVEGVSVA